MFHSGYDNWPVNIDGVALVNTAFVWLPVALAAIFPNTLRWLGLARVGLTPVNGIILDRGDQADMCKHDRVLFLPFTILRCSASNAVRSPAATSA